MLRKGIIALSLMFAAATASAKTITEQYDVMSYNMSQHSLYMNGARYHFQTGASFVRYDDDTGSLTGTATNGSGNGYTVSLSFANFRDWTQQSAAGLGAKGSHLGDKTSWTYMDLVSSSTLTGIGAYAGTMYDLLMKPLNGPYTFQYGVGANDKQAGVLGLSGWFYTAGNYANGTGYPCKKNATNDGGSVCDFNLKMEENPGSGGVVPLPAGIALLPVGFGMLAAMRRRQKRKAA